MGNMTILPEMTGWAYAQGDSISRLTSDNILKLFQHDLRVP